MIAIAKTTVGGTDTNLFCQVGGREKGRGRERESNYICWSGIQTDKHTLRCKHASCVLTILFILLEQTVVFDWI